MTEQQEPAKKKAPAGWYDDPKFVNTRRYWDGEKWTDQRLEKPEASQKAVASRGRLGLAGGSMAVLGVIAIVVGVFVVRHVARPKMDVAGTMSLIGADNFTTIGTLCHGDGGYDDMHSGASVVIKNSDGKTIGLGSLGSPSASAGVCTFDFKVENIDARGDLYSVEVSHRGDVSFRHEEAESLSLTIGD